MVKVSGPAMSMDASGKLGDSLVFSKWKGRNYIRRLVKPANPKSGGQTGVRSMMRFLAQKWAAIIAGSQATWETPAEAYNISPFNAYVKENLLRNRNFLAPSQAYPATVDDTASTIDGFAAVAGERQITITMDDLADEDTNWAFLIYRSTSIGFTPAFDNLVAVLLAAAAVPVVWVDTPLVPDTYYYDSKPFTPVGSIGALKGEINATVT